MSSPLIFQRLFVLLTVVIVSISVAFKAAEAFETEARAAILVDMETGQTLFEKDADLQLQPASMSKLMTTYMILKQLRDGRLKMDDTLPVSKKAWKKGGSKMFVEIGKRIRVDDLLRGIIILSGNDACIVAAEGLAGSEEQFAKDMTAKAREIGLTNSNFANASGWPHPDHLMTARDLATLAIRLIEDFPDHYYIFAERDFEYSRHSPAQPQPPPRPRSRRRRSENRTHRGSGLRPGRLRRARGTKASVGGDGLELGAGTRHRKRTAARARVSGVFRNYPLMAKGQEIDHANVWLGKELTVPMVIDRDIKVSLTDEARRQLQIKLIYDTPIPAPIRAGTEIAKVKVEAPGLAMDEIPVFAGADVQKADFVGRVTGALEYLIFGPS